MWDVLFDFDVFVCLLACMCFVVCFVDDVFVLIDLSGRRFICVRFFLNVRMMSTRQVGTNEWLQHIVVQKVVPILSCKYLVDSEIGV